MANLKIGALILAAFVAGAFFASPELRAYAAATITSADIVNETIQSADIKNGQVKNSDLAANAVTYSKINANSIDATKIVDGSVTSDDLAPGVAPDLSSVQGQIDFLQAQIDGQNTGRSIVVTPESGVIGSSVTITGSGFSPNAPISVKFDNSVNTLTQSGDNNADASGDFTRNITVPSGVGNTPGLHHITASDGIQIASYPYTLITGS